MFIVKELVFLSFVKHKISKILFLRQNLWLNFPSRQKFLRHDLFLGLPTSQRKSLYFHPLCHVILALYLLIFGYLRGGVDIFILIMHFLNDKMGALYVTIAFLRLQTYLEVP